MSENLRFRSFEFKPKYVQLTYVGTFAEQGSETEKERVEKVYRNASSNLHNIVKTLLGHALIITNFSNGKLNEKDMKARKVVDMPAFQDMEIKGFYITKDGDDREIEFLIEKTNLFGKSLTFKTGKVQIVSQKYIYSDLLKEDVDNCINEIAKFQKGTNYQMDLFDNDEEEVEEEEEQL